MAGRALLVVLVTCPTQRVGRQIADLLVRGRLAACVNVIPAVESIYWWEGKVERGREVLLVIKTSAARFEALRRAVAKAHPYTVPEIIALPLTRGHQPYLGWVRRSVR